MLERLKRTSGLLAAVAACGLGTPLDARGVSFGSSGEPSLQVVLDGITVGGGSSVDAFTDYLPDDLDSVWRIDGTSGTVSTIVIELAGYAGDNVFGIYDVSDPDNKVRIFRGRNDSGDQKTLTIDASGNVEVNNRARGVFAGNEFGFYLATPGSSTGYWYSDSALNVDANGDHMVAYQGTGDTVQIASLAERTWSSAEYILGFEDLAIPVGDSDYNDFVVLVSSVTPVPDIGTTLMLLALGTGGLFLLRCRRLSSQI